MKEGLTSLDLMFLIKEIKDRVIKAKIRAIKQNKNDFCMELYKLGKFNLKIFLPKIFYLTPLPFESQKRPSSFCMLLRKHLVNKTIEKIDQHDFDRIVKIEVQGYRLIIELFSKGNIILTDEKFKIIGVLRREKWREREIRPGVTYKYPPPIVNPFSLNFQEFDSVLKKEEREIVKVLATTFGLGGVYAEDICKTLKILKTKSSSALTNNEKKKLFKFFENLKKKKPEGFIVMEEGEWIDVSPLDLSIYDKNLKIKTESLNDALETYFEKLIKKRKEVHITDYKLRTIIEKQEEHLKELVEKEKKYRKIAELLYEKYEVFERILRDVINWRSAHESWEKVEKLMEKEKMLKGIFPSKAEVVVKVNDVEIPLDFRKSVKKNAEEYFEKAKKFRKKIENLKKKLEELKKKGIERKIEKKEKEEKKRWYEKFRWFKSSDNFLVVAGKDAKTNDLLIRKYVQPSDLVFHADIRGSPFGVIKNEEGLEEIPDQTIKETAEFIASYSKAWLKGLASIDVYWVKPEQVVRSVWLPLGSFIIEGKKNWVRKVPLEICIGVKKNERVRLIAGPPSVVKKKTPYFVILVPGRSRVENMIEKIKEVLIKKVPNDLKFFINGLRKEDIERFVPYGICEILEK